MIRKKPDGSFGVGKGEFWLWFRKVQFKDGRKRLVVNVSKRVVGSGVRGEWEHVGTVYLEKEDVVGLKFEFEHLVVDW